MVLPELSYMPSPTPSWMLKQDFLSAYDESFISDHPVWQAGYLLHEHNSKRTSHPALVCSPAGHGSNYHDSEMIKKEGLNVFIFLVIIDRL